MLREIREKMAAVLKTSVNARPKLKYLNLSCDQKEAQQELLGCEVQEGTQSNFWRFGLSHAWYEGRLVF